MVEKIERLKRERNAIILAHNYQLPEVQDVADYTGDSLGLSIQASETDAEVIVFCGVHFMAETAALICPDKLVLEPHRNAGCLMADMITVRQLREWKQRHPDAAVVCYVNSTAQIKAESDMVCTSANSVKVVQSIPEDKTILFVPDKSLGDWTAKQSGRELMLWEGYCPTHHRILTEDIRKARAAHPDAVVMVHPECTADVIALADEVFSTGGMGRYAAESAAREMIVGTEIGLLHRLRKENPGKTFYPASPLADCVNMKLNTLEKILWALEDRIYEVRIPEELAERARRPIERMLAL
ncbi:MAG: quinolinate synthase NadA [Candidatus Latescibacteria bacterium]|nr:quinolinate synthase NadA [Candidatus Latescibacterota bacterium]